MRVTIAAVGRDRPGAVRVLFDDYRRRCPWSVDLVLVAPRRLERAERRLEDEGGRLLRAVPGGASLIALDERGRDIDSLGFARQIDGWRSEGAGDLTFAIGGPDGLAPPVLERAALILALGRMTWPHELVRVMLMEQLYRASALLAGHPYHRA